MGWGKGRPEALTSVHPPGNKGQGDGEVLSEPPLQNKFPPGSLPTRLTGLASNPMQAQRASNAITITTLFFFFFVGFPL